MKSITERPPILTVHEDHGDYILRVGDVRFRSLIVGVSKLLPDARRLIVVTPGDVKFFVMGGSSDAAMGVDTDSDTPVDDMGSDVPEDVVAEQESHVVPNAQQDEEPEPPVEPPKRTRRRKPLREDVRVGHDENCQRCAGTGKARILMDGGVAAETTCPICQGGGTIRRYGARR